MAPVKNLTIDPERLWDELMETARIGATPKGGICRLTLTDLDRQVRDWFKARAEELGCTRHRRRHGRDVRAPRRARAPTCRRSPLGSHLDTQPTGGKFDGVLGVLAALEALRTLVRAGYETFAPIEVVNWTNEEGSRFAPAMVASGVFAGVFTHDWAYGARRPRRRDLRRGARRDRLSRAGALRRASAVRVLRTAHRAGPDPRGRGQGHRRRHRRAGDALVRGDGDRPGRPHRHHADAAPARRAARRGAAGRGGRRQRASAIRRRRRHRRAARGQARTRPTSCRARCSSPSTCAIPIAAVLDAHGRRGHRGWRRSASANSGCTIGIKNDLGCSRRRAFDADCIAAVRARRALSGYSHARHGLRRRPRRGLCVARRAGRDDLRAVQGRHQPQRGGVFVQGAMRRRARRCCCRRCSITTAGWPSAREIIFRHSGTARSAGPGIQMQVRHMFLDSGFARFASAPE